jgi:hypothetical protein
LMFRELSFLSITKFTRIFLVIPSKDSSQKAIELCMLASI